MVPKRCPSVRVSLLSVNVLFIPEKLSAFHFAIQHLLFVSNTHSSILLRFTFRFTYHEILIGLATDAEWRTEVFNQHAWRGILLPWSRFIVFASSSSTMNMQFWYNWSKLIKRNVWPRHQILGAEGHKKFAFHNIYDFCSQNQLILTSVWIQSVCVEFFNMCSRVDAMVFCPDDAGRTFAGNRGGFRWATSISQQNVSHHVQGLWVL